jgi:D-inositol-3-phosphate glycosyltransferase
VKRIAMLSLHSSPLDQPGAGSSGGMNVYVRDLSRSLTSLDLNVDIYTRSNDGLTVMEDVPGVRVIGMPGCRSGAVTKNEIADMVPALIQGIDDVVRRERLSYDVVHSHYWISGMAGRRLAAQWDVPHVQMFHTLSRIKSKFAGSAPDARRERTEIRLLQTADAVVVSNPIERMQIRALYPEHCSHLVSIPCGIDVNTFHRLDRRPDAGDRFTVVALGRLERLKNFGLLLDAVACACQENSDFARAARVLIAGGSSSDEPDEARRLAEQAVAQGVSRVVTFTGPIVRELVPRFYAAADVCVVPSLHESFGLVALEAMASGLPVVATRTGGMQLTVVDSVSGFLVDPQDPAEMADRLLMLWRSPLLRAHMGLRGGRAAQHYAWPVVAERTRCLYEALVSGRQSSDCVCVGEADRAGT